MLHEFVAVYVPSTRHALPITPAEHDAAVLEVASHLARICGGFTATKGTGGWLSDTEGLIVENVTIVKAFCSPELKARALVECHALADWICRTFEQEAVSIETEDGIEFVS